MKRIMLFAAILSLGLVGCNKDPKVVDPTLSISPDVVTVEFGAEALESYTFTVTTNQSDWNVEVTDNDVIWVGITIISGNEFRITAIENESTEGRSTHIRVFAGDAADITFSVTQLAAEVIVVPDPDPYPHYYELNLGGIPIEYMSGNGRYISGYFDETGIVYDLSQIDEAGYMGPLYFQADHPEFYTANTGYMMKGVTNDGVPFMHSVSGDGSRILDYTTVSNNNTGYITIDGTKTQLPKPTAPWKMTGSDYYGVIPDRIASDGSVILGRIMTYGNIWVACKWVWNGSAYEFAEVAPDEMVQQNNSYKDINVYATPNSATGLSSTGFYSAGTIRNKPGGTYTPYVNNMQTGTTVKVAGENDGIGTTATDDGILFYSKPYAYVIGGDRVPYVYENGASMTFAEWVLENYGLTVANKGFVSAVSADKSVVVWFSNEPAPINGYLIHVIIVK